MIQPNLADRAAVDKTAHRNILSFSPGLSTLVGFAAAIGRVGSLRARDLIQSHPNRDVLSNLYRRVK
jgi:hypothetical protein